MELWACRVGLWRRKFATAIRESDLTEAKSDARTNEALLQPIFSPLFVEGGPSVQGLKKWHGGMPRLVPRFRHPCNYLPFADAVFRNMYIVFIRAPNWVSSGLNYLIFSVNFDFQLVMFDFSAIYAW